MANAVTKAAKDAAYEAGRHALATEPPERRHPDSCPFSPIEHPDERDAWLQGFQDALNDQPKVDDLHAAIKEAKSA